MTPRQRAFYQGLFGLGAGILANNAPSRVPGGGMRALGKGLQLGLQSYNQALTMEEKMDALREERALKGELEERIPDLIAQARLMGVDEGILRSAELMASVKPSSVVATLNNAMVKAQKDPRSELTSEQLIYTDPNSKRQFRIKSDGYLGEEIKALPEEEKTDQTFVVDSEMRQMIGLPENVTTGKTEGGIRKFYDKFGQEVTSFPEVSEPVIREGTVTAINQPGFEDQAYIFLNGKNQLIKKTDIKQAKEQAGYTYSTPDNMPEGASQLEEDPQGKRRFVDENYNTVETPKVEPKDEGPQRFSVTPQMAQRLRLPANVTQGMEVDGVIQYFDNLGVRVTEGPKVQEAKKPFEYIDRATSEARFPALFAQMGKNDAIEFNPETGKAQIIHAPGADSEDLDYREIVSADGKMRQQGYYSKSTGELVTDLGMTPVKVDKGLETKDKLKFLIDRHKKPSDRLQAMVSNYESISTAVGAGKPFDDLALIFYIAKMLDPTSVVREGEQMIIRNTGALPDKFISYFTRLKDGKAFTKDQRRNILEFAKRKMDAELKTYNQVVDGVKRDAGENRFNLSYENEVVPALGIIHDKMDTSQSFNKVMDSINKLEDPLGGEEKLNTEGDSGIKQIVFDAVNEAIDARSAKDSRKKIILSNQDGDSILE